MPEPIRTIDLAEVQSGLYIQDGRTLYKVSTVYENRITAQVCWERGQTPGRTTVRSLGRSAVAGMSVATDRIIKRYHDALDRSNA